PFALTSPSQFLPPGPTQRTLLQLDEEVTDTLLHSATLTDLQKVRAEYWADGPDSETPPGHWCLFAQTVSRARGHSLDQDVKLFFALGNAELDASIASWNAKRRWDYVRPITAVRERKRGQLVLAWAGPNKGTRLIRGETWHPYQAATFPTPPFPEYVSGHSTFSGAGARVLQRFTGSDLFGARVTVRRGSSFIEPGRTPLLPQVLIWPTFSGAAAEAGVSRRLGGIHFPDADLHGRELGASVGQNAWQKAQTYFNGTASG
ncbi:MAG TPA: vanadium-dependent haloperoxidase, partial [Euzebyales bacterium]|nr:vanadium-dependent haloperoxidase [Euzebyales bacterium]